LVYKQLLVQSFELLIVLVEV